MFVKKIKWQPYVLFTFFILSTIAGFAVQEGKNSQRHGSKLAQYLGQYTQ